MRESRRMGGECKPGCFLRDSWAGQERQAAWDTGEQRSLAMAVHHLRSPNPVGMAHAVVVTPAPSP